MNSQSQQLQNEELEALAGGGVNDLLKKLALGGKVARWATVAASVVGISVGMVMPAEATHRATCEDGTLNIWQVDPLHGVPDKGFSSITMCFVDAGELPVLIADVKFFTYGRKQRWLS